MAAGAAARLARYWHTLRHLRPVQFYGRAWFRLARPRPDLRAPPPRREGGHGWQAPARRRASLTGADTVVFLNRPGRIATAADWNSPAHDKLWLYNLHYFDDLAAEGAADRRTWHETLIERWIDENPPGHGNGWEPYPLSLRIVSWVKWMLAGNAPTPAMLASLAVQTRFLARRLEWHLLGNHLLANAKALVYAGLFFAGPEAEAWRATGLAILARELPEQVLADGGHFELSPMYHAIILEDLLDLANLGAAFPGVVGADVAGRWREAIGRMRTWLAAMLHPDGGIAFFNDAAFAIAPEARDLEAYAHRLGLGPSRAPGGPITHLDRSGYVRLAVGDAVALLDVAPVGPDYLPGHAHADTLSFELSLLGGRVVVNSGTSVYGHGGERQRQRATAAHSTVEVDGQSSSEVWGGFRVARRARPFDLALSAQEGTAVVTCAHDGYLRLTGRVVHRREWRLGARSLVVRDRVEGDCRQAVARFLLHPRVGAGGSGGDGWLELAGGHRVGWRLTGGAASIVPATWHPEFGASVPTLSIEVPFARECALTLEW